jgi:hypothetical protein
LKIPIRIRIKSEKQDPDPHQDDADLQPGKQRLILVVPLNKDKLNNLKRMDKY